jgi:hypothetical protein
VPVVGVGSWPIDGVDPVETAAEAVRLALERAGEPD